MVINLSDCPITLKRNPLLGTATEIDAMLVAREDRRKVDQQLACIFVDVNDLQHHGNLRCVQFP